MNAAEALIQNGAKKVIAFCTHPVFSGPACERLQNSCLEAVIVTDSIQHPDGSLPSKIKVLSISKILAEAISRVHNRQSVTALFN